MWWLVGRWWGNGCRQMVGKMAVGNKDEDSYRHLTCDNATGRSGRARAEAARSERAVIVSQPARHLYCCENKAGISRVAATRVQSVIDINKMKKKREKEQKEESLSHF